MMLIIDIPEGLKKDFELEQWTALSCMEMKNALMNGTPLPKGHGRIIDESKITSIYYHEEKEKQGAMKVNWIVIDGTDAPTIIAPEEAKNEGERRKASRVSGKDGD